MVREVSEGGERAVQDAAEIECESESLFTMPGPSLAAHPRPLAT